LWKLDTLPKVRVFSWRVGHELLLTNVKIASIRSGFDQGCPRCGVAAETLIHALKECPTSRELLSIGDWDTSTMSRGKDDKAQSIWDRASNLSKDFRIYNILNEPLLSQNVIIKKWEKPPKGFVKINLDATVEVNKMGYGMIIRDDDDFVLGAAGVSSLKGCQCMGQSVLRLREALSWRVNSILMAWCFLKPTTLAS
ncbi:hypothetical protein Gotri_014392, partial [Gossypium trilobum]|nr:hypothetical protein [Gossypium trilobum]